ncbi:MAG: cupin domain-containing protein [Bdellovibrionales bacterium]|nr:cupin domain-containing protein [Bdellovibrionales bacterium]
MIPIILCGGSGTRLWPLLKKKSFYNFFGNKSLLDLSLERLKSFGPITLVTTKQFKENLDIALQSKQLKIETVYEPEAKNTAISIALVCYLFSKRKDLKDKVLGFFPSDHFIEKEQEFKNIITQGIEISKSEKKIITFGIPPSSKLLRSDYGYIKVKKTNSTFFKVLAFIEKPDERQALGLLKKGYLWNSGIFISPLDLLIQYFEKYLSQLWEKILSLENHSIDFVYKNLDSISFDKGIMENVKQALCLPFDVAWSDLGSWESLADWSQKNPGVLNNQAFKFETDSKNNFVFSSENKIAGLIGIENTLVINEKEGLLISKKGHSKNIKSMYKKLSNLKPSFVKKPWGTYSVLLEKDFFKYKELRVHPGQKLSYQSHKNRKEHWIVIKGQAEVYINGLRKILNENEHVFIDQGIKHQLKNPNSQTLLILEIQMGHCLEEDIIRYKDKL